jgi:hypothetical protein
MNGAVFSVCCCGEFGKVGIRLAVEFSCAGARYELGAQKYLLGRVIWVIVKV